VRCVPALRRAPLGLRARPGRRLIRPRREAPLTTRGRSRARASFFDPRGPLARVLPGYEERPGQRRLSEAIGRVLTEGGTLLAEAGTGTGKTLAYLLPAVDLGERVVVSTGTKNLQEQLVTKDIPLLAKALGRSLRVALMKGRANYLCRLRFQSFAASPTFARLAELPLFRTVERWAKRTVLGDRAEIDGLPDSVVFWRDISAASENCIGQSCSRFEDCFVTRMRQRALEADLVVVNHHLLCADLAVKESSYGRVVPEYDTVVLDEAHMLEDVATQYFGLQMSFLRANDLARDVERELSAAKIDARDVRAEAEGLRARAERLFQSLAAQKGRRLAGGWMSPQIEEETGALLHRYDGLRTAILALSQSPDAVAGLAARSVEQKEELAFLTAADDDRFVYFVEARGRAVFLRATPVDVSEVLRERLFGGVRAAALTSATLAVDEGFSYIKGRLGIASAESLLVPSPFDYAKQALLYVPRGMPEPSSPTFVREAADEIVRLLAASRGRAFVLFTSYANMNGVAERIAEDIPFPVFVQGEAPKGALLEAFRNTPGAVLLATGSFWQGVDVVGEQLSCVIIDKLPFASPADPVVAARIERLRARGESPFDDYQVPEAILALKQGLGRLIRSTSDRGVLAVLDSRIVERPYGTRFLASLPPAPLTHDVADVERFFEAGGAAPRNDG
jgi:ATP-dependent DNA helicase DinG